MNLKTPQRSRDRKSWLHFLSARWRGLGMGLLAAAAVSLFAGCQSDPVFPTAGLPDIRAMNYATNLLHEGDVVGVTFQFTTNFDTAQKISLDGTVIMDSVGAVKAAGKTVEELQADLARLYKPQLDDDVVTVKLISSASGVWVSGAVLRPGKIPMDQPMTALEAIMEAGGFDLTHAKLSDVSIMRLENGRQKTYRMNLNKTLSGADDQPFYLRPSDIIFVPLKTFNL